MAIDDYHFGLQLHVLFLYILTVALSFRFQVRGPWYSMMDNLKFKLT